ncbi:MAG: acetylxylan esterase, partial [Paludibacteraceae bacterium]|nr:acetylxylan esterase [Paludibacteraceae bacterium]
MKKIFILFAALVFTATMMASCEPINGGVTPEEPKDTIPVKLDPLKQSVPVTDNWVFDTKPAITIHIENPNAVAVEAKVIAKITTDLKKAVTSIEKVVEVPANGTLDVPVTTPEDLAPGFYRAHCIVNNKGARTFNFGISPEKIVSAPDKQPDFDEYWAAAKEQLDSIDMNAQLTLLEKKSTDKRKIYLVELQSVPDSPDGDPVIVRGYYAEPQDGQKHPVIMHFYGYDSQNATSWPPCPGGNDSEYAEFFFSIRGQMLNNRGAT